MPSRSDPTPTVPRDLPPAARRIWLDDPFTAFARRPDGFVPIASARVARTAKVRASSLHALARTRLALHGWAVASDLTAWRSLGAAVAEQVGPDDASAWRRALARPVAELLAAGVGLGDAAPSDRFPDLPPDLSHGTGVAWRVAIGHAGRLAARRLVDGAAVLPMAASLARIPGAPDPAGPAAYDAEAPWFVVAPIAPSAAECRWIAVAAPARSIVALAPEAGDAVARLSAHGFVVDPDASRVAPLPRAVAHSFPTADDELRWMLTHDRDLGGEGDADPPLLVTADPTTAAPRIEAAAWELGIPVRVEHPIALRRTALGGFLLLVADAIERGMPFEATLQTLRHRFAGGMTDAAFVEARSRRPQGADAWRAIDARSEVLAWPRRAPRRAHARRLHELLARFGLPGDVLAPHESAALQLVLRGIAEEALPASEGDEEVDTGVRTFLADLRDLLGLLTVQAPAVRGDPPSGARPVRVASPAQAAELRVRSVRVLGMNEGVLPADVVDPPILDAHDRGRLREVGIDLADTGEPARAAWAGLTAALRAAGEEAILGVPERAGGDALLPSPYLDRLGLEPRPAPPREPASPEERRRIALPGLLTAGDGATGDVDDEGLRRAIHGWRIERAREGSGPPDRFDGIAGRPLALGGPDGWRFSATSLQTLGQCGFRFFARYRLGVAAFEERDERITPQLRGRLWHHALERAVGHALTSDPRSDPEGDDDLRDRVVDALPDAYADAERAVGVPDPDGDAWRRVRAGEVRALVRFVRSDAFLTPGFRPRAVERHFAADWRGLSVGGVVDRIDVGPSGVELIDYKSGTTAPKGALGDDRRSWIDVQLPLYLEAAAPTLLAGDDAAPASASTAPGDAAAADPAAGPSVSLRARYLSIRSAATLASVEPGEHDAALDELVGRVRRSCATGSWPVDPDPRREVCRTCELAIVCRVGPRIERKRDAEAVRSQEAGS